MTDVNIGQLAASTLRNRKKDFADNALNSNALLYKLNKRGNVRTIVEGGRSIVEPVLYDGNGTFTRYSGFQTLNINDGDVLDAAEFTPVQAAVNFTISGREMRMNRGVEKAVDLIEAKMEGAKATLANNLTQDIYSAGTTSNQVGGLQLLVADDPTTSTSVGGINQSTYSWWRNQTYDFSSNSKTAAADMLEGLGNLVRQCSFGNDRPDLIVMDMNYYGIFENALLDLRRFGSEESELAKAGFKAIKWNGADVVFEHSASGIPSNHAYVLNTKYLKLQMYQGAAMEPDFDGKTDGIRPVDQDGLVFPILFMGNLTTNGRRYHGVLKD